MATFRQLGNLYGSSSAGKRWEKTLVAWLTSKGVDFVQGKNEKSAFFCATRVLRLLTYSDDLFVRGRRKHVRWFFEVLGARFKIKAPVYLDKDSIIDHLGMNIFEGQDGVYLTMQSYIEVMESRRLKQQAAQRRTLRVSREQDHGAQGAANTEGSGIYESLVHALRAHAQPGDGYASKAYIIGVHQRLRGHRANHRFRALPLRSAIWRRAATSRAINRPGL